jgi:hypothetical protein
VIIAIPGILIGLLAMHFMVTPAASHTPHASGVVAEISAPHDEQRSVGYESAHSHPVAQCDGLCGPEHDMLGMACILALLLTALWATARLAVLQWGSPRAAIGVLVAGASTLLPPRPPSLLALSISRT